MSVQDQGLDPTADRYQVIPRTLTFITHGDDILLLKGARDKRIWPGLYNGVGGHVERGEDVLASARREIREEVGLDDLRDMQLRAVVNIETSGANPGIMMFVFTASSPTRVVRASAEGTPEWIDRQELPVERCVPDLPHLLPRVLFMRPDQPPLFGRYWYDDRDRLQVAFYGD
jgi:8-oxo-dGTP diphosphatase